MNHLNALDATDIEHSIYVVVKTLLKNRHLSKKKT